MYFLEAVLGTLGVRWVYTLDGTSQYLHSDFTVHTL